MLHKTRGIVLNFIRYGETSVIVRVFTDKFGLQSYLVNGVRSKKSKYKIGLFQPLTLLDMVVYHKQQQGLNRLSELRINYPLQHVPFSMKRSSIALFITEVLMQCLRSEEEEPRLFQFLYESVVFLDTCKEGFENFHLQFLLRLSAYLGFAPGMAEDLYTEVKNGTFDAQMFSNELSALNLLLQSELGATVKISNAARRKLLEILLNFYQMHVPNFKPVKSVDILKQVLEG